MQLARKPAPLPSRGRAILLVRGRRVQSNFNPAVLSTPAQRSCSLIEDKLDVLITVGALPDSSYTAQKLGMSDLVIVAAPGYLDLHGTPPAPEELGDHFIVLSGRRDGPAYARWTLTRGNQREIVFVPARVVCREGVHMHEACLGGAGIARSSKFRFASKSRAGPCAWFFRSGLWTRFRFRLSIQVARTSPQRYRLSLASSARSSRIVTRRPRCRLLGA